MGGGEEEKYAGVSRAVAEAREGVTAKGMFVSRSKCGAGIDDAETWGRDE